MRQISPRGSPRVCILIDSVVYCPAFGRVRPPSSAIRKVIGVRFAMTGLAVAQNNEEPGMRWMFAFAAAAICAYAGLYRDECAAAIAHYDYSTICLGEFFRADVIGSLL